MGLFSLDDRGICRLVRKIKEAWYPPPAPGELKLKQISEGPVMALKYEITLPAPNASDVVKRKLTTKINDGEETVTELPGNALKTEALYADNDTISLFLIDVDDADNPSPASPTLVFVAKDTIAPGAPGELGATLIEEVN